jgi:hypothetical protein
LFVVFGLVWLSQLPVNGSYTTSLLPALVAIPIGIGMTFMPLIAAATSGVQAHQAGLASGLITTSQQMGGALGLAILSGGAASVTTSSAYLGRAAATVHGFDRSMFVAIAFMFFALALAVVVIKQPRKSDGGAEHERVQQLDIALEV